MIFVSTGTNEQPFDRLVRAAAALDVGEPLLVQHGASSAGPTGDGWRAFLSFEEMADAMRAARVVIVHAGVGSVLLARTCGKVPIVVPRRVALGEAVDDHQIPFARRMAANGLVTLVEDEAELQAAVASRHPERAAGEGRERNELATELREYLNTMVMT